MKLRVYFIQIGVADDSFTCHTVIFIVGIKFEGNPVDIRMHMRTFERVQQACPSQIRPWAHEIKVRVDVHRRVRVSVGWHDIQNKKAFLRTRNRNLCRIYLLFFSISPWYTCMKISQIPLHLRPRERAWKEGVDRLSDAELLAIILRSGKKGRSAVEQAHELLSSCDGDLNTLKNNDTAGLVKQGIGKVQSLSVHAALELGSRLHRPTSEPLFMENAVVNVSSLMRCASKELFYLICLDLRGKCIGAPLLLNTGTRFRVQIDAREIMNKAIQREAGKILVMHNHPSNIADPSPAEIILTKQILEASKWMDIELVDHVIVTKEEMFSMRANGMLD